jgi:hypothetical protein
MSAEKDITLSEKRVYEGKQPGTQLFVACRAGLLEVSVSDALVGAFGLVHRGDVRDVAASDGILIIATDDDVLFGVAGEDDSEVMFESTGFGPAVAVSACDGPVASDGERVARYNDGQWETTAELTGVRALNESLIAAENGVFRLDGTHLGLPGARDVDEAGTPLAATDDGLYYLGNGWLRAVEVDAGPFHVVASHATDGRAHAAGDRLYERRTGQGGSDRISGTQSESSPGEKTGADADWSPIDVSGMVVGITHTNTTYAVTAKGILWAYDPSESTWREHILGVRNVRALTRIS